MNSSSRRESQDQTFLCWKVCNYFVMLNMLFLFLVRPEVALMKSYFFKAFNIMYCKHWLMRSREKLTDK